jgi:hypothetical protein
MKKNSWITSAQARLVLGGMGLLTAVSASAQFTPAEINEIKNIGATRVEALDVIGADYGLNGGSYESDNNVKVNISKFGGMGDIGDPIPIGTTGLAWQPRLQGSMGYVTSRKSYYASAPAPELNGAHNEYDTFAIQFGGGARIWFNDYLSLAPTIMGMYGHTGNSFTDGSFTPTEIQNATKAGIIDWHADTWTVRPAGQLAYVFTWRRTIFTLTSDGTYFYTQSFDTSNPNFSIAGGSEMWQNRLDVDVPLGVQIYNHEIRTGGYFSRSDFFGGLQQGLNNDYLYEIHGRVVLDFLGQLWKCQWIGLGYSYLWGANFHGVSYGVDLAFRF